VSVTFCKLKVPMRSGTTCAWYQLPVSNEESFNPPAPGKPVGTKASPPTEEATPRAVRSITRSGATSKRSFAWHMSFSSLPAALGRRDSGPDGLL
jgi:hypothetical protein